MLSPQEKFDTVVRHLVEQGAPAITDNGYCHYLVVRTGAKCAAGCLLSAEQLAMVSVSGWAQQSSELQESVGDIVLVQDLQRDHDIAAARDPTMWRTWWVCSMRDTAGRHGLNTSVLEELATKEWQRG